MFGALRRLLQSGDIRSVLQESRRSFSDIAAVLGTPTNRARQRALDDMNARGGISGPNPTMKERGDYRTDAFLSDPDFLGRERYVDPFAPNRLRDPNAATEYYGMLPDGRRLQFNPQTGSRSTFVPQSSNPH